MVWAHRQSAYGRVPHLILVLLASVFVQTGTRAATDIILRAADAPTIRGAWTIVADASAAGGSRLANPDVGAPKPGSPAAAPSSYFELSFEADAGTPYHLWIRGRASEDRYENDSVWAQFSDTVASDGTPIWRIGTTAAASIVLEDCSGCGVAGWGWQDNQYGGVAPPLYFAGSGLHTIRIQVREDGLSIDQIVLSAATYLDTAPGALTNDATILTAGTSPPRVPPPLTRGPYLQQVSANAAVIVWASPDPAAGFARVNGQLFPAATTFYPATVTGIPDYFQHEALVSGLADGTSYTYQLFAGDTPVTDGRDQFRTAPSTGTGSVRFIVFGDSGTGSIEQRAVAARIDADGADLVLHAGDIAYGNGGGTGDASYATYQSWFFDIYGSWLRRRPFFPSPGNHDTRASNNWGEAYLNLFSLPADAGLGPFSDHAERYYSFDYGPVHFIALDTERAFQDASRRAAQLTWLASDLQRAAGQPWKVAFYHRSPFSAGGEHGSDLAVREAFAPLFERYGVQLSLTAHEHTFERSVPWRVGTAPAQAVTYVVAGGGGGPLYPSGHDAWTAASASEHHYVRVTVNGCFATIEAIRASGSILDSHALDRCAQAADTQPPAVDFANIAPGSAVAGTVVVYALASDDVHVEKVDFWIDGQLHDIDRTAPYDFTWNASVVASGPHTLELRAYDIGGNRSSRTAVVNVVPGTGPAVLPDGWLTQDIGAVALTGDASSAGGTFTVSGAGADIWGTLDAFRFVYQPLARDGAIVARVGSVDGSEPWTKVGVMIRASAEADAAHAFMFVSLGEGLAFQRRVAPGALSTHTAGPSAGAPAWVRLARSGNIVTASVSNDGVHWTTVDSDAIALPATALAGIAVTSHTTSAIATGRLDSVSVNAGEPALPSPWHSFDVGAVGLPGHTAGDGSTFTVRGAGADIWDHADAFQFAARPLGGNGDIVARVASMTGTHEWTKAGVMIRASLEPGAAHAFVLVSLDMGLAFQRRPIAGGASVNTSMPGATPMWVKLSRRDQQITAAVSVDGVTWTVLGTETLAISGPVLAGLAVTNHDASALATAVFDNVLITAP